MAAFALSSLAHWTFEGPGLCFGFGIVFVGYIWFLAAAIRQWFRRRDPLAVGLGGGMIMALVSIGIHSLVDFNMHIPANALSTMVVAGLGWNALFVRTR
jgi:predicted tellurium resistance membrane protein TerC